jgi:hypothetical protein
MPLLEPKFGTAQLSPVRNFRSKDVCQLPTNQSLSQILSAGDTRKIEKRNEHLAGFDSEMTLMGLVWIKISELEGAQRVCRGNLG